MARTKLTAEARAQIVAGYRQAGVTVSMLAEQFGISSSTASRVLKEDIPAEEYKTLVKQKRGGRPSKQKKATQPSLLDVGADPTDTEDEKLSAYTGNDKPPLISAQPNIELESETESKAEESETDSGADEFEDARDKEDEFEEDEQLGVELFGDDDDESEDEYEGDDDDEDDDEDDDGRWDEQPSQVEVVGPPPVWYSAVQANPEFAAPVQQEPISIVVLEEEDLPGECFAVVDRFQELTTCPMQEFNHLGDVPNELAEAKTLPLFDSHRVARRFSDRFRHRGRHKHRVIGFPGYFLSAAREQLQEKGITHLLMDNQVYEL